MDIKTLESLGINAETLGQRIVDQAVEALLYGVGYDEDGEETTRSATRFKREIEGQVQKAVDQKIAALAAVHLVPKVGEIIESLNLQKTNSYGEKLGPALTFIEYMAARADAYMSETVNINGESKEESGNHYNWIGYGPRLTVLMKMYIRSTMEDHAKKAVSDINAVIAKNIAKAAQDAITATAAAIKVSVST